MHGMNTGTNLAKLWNMKLDNLNKKFYIQFDMMAQYITYTLMS